MQGISNEFITQLAAANGIDLPAERVELVRREYENLMRGVKTIDGLLIPRETEPALGQSLAVPAIAAADERR